MSKIGLVEKAKKWWTELFTNQSVETDTVILVDEQGNQEIFEVCDFFNYGNEEYAVVKPLGKFTDESLIVRQLDDGFIELLDDDEFDDVSEYYASFD